MYGDANGADELKIVKSTTFSCGAGWEMAQRIA
jgi:hypothetical protein